MRVRLAKEEDKTDLIEMINNVYKTSEKEFWKEGYYRIREEEYLNLVRQRELYVLLEDEEKMGCVRLEELEPMKASFSMLTCHPDHRQKGIGKFLVDFAHIQAKSNGCRRMQLQLLQPTDWVHDEKVFLLNWYKQLGYEETETLDFTSKYPDHQQFMKCGLEFTVLEKRL